MQVAAIYDLRSGLYSDAPEEDREADIRLGVDLVDVSIGEAGTWEFVCERIGKDRGIV